MNIRGGSAFILLTVLRNTTHMAKKITDTSRRNDRLAEILIRIGGVLVIVSVVWILVMISRVALPLFFPASANITASVKLGPTVPSNKIIALGVEDSQQGAFVLDDNGQCHFIKVHDGSLSASVKVPVVPEGATRIISAEPRGKSIYDLQWNDGSVTSIKVDLTAVKDAAGGYTLTHDVVSQPDLSFPAAKGIKQSYARLVEGKGALRVDQLGDDRLQVRHQLIEKDFLGNEKRTDSTTAVSDPLPGKLSVITVDSKGHYLYVGTDNGMLLRWDISEPGQAHLVDTVQASAERQAITSLSLVLGDVSIAVGDAKGGFSTWFPVKVAGSGEDKRLTRIHTLRPNSSAITTTVR